MQAEQIALPFDGGFRLKPPVTNDQACADVMITEVVPGWLDAHSPDHVHGETHVHFDQYLTCHDEYRATKDGPGYVYFIQNTFDHLIKIGESKNPSKRLKMLQTAAGHPLELIGRKFVKLRKLEEISLHEQFEEDRLEGGEWFLPSVGLLNYIGEL